MKNLNFKLLNLYRYSMYSRTQDLPGYTKTRGKGAAIPMGFCYANQAMGTTLHTVCSGVSEL